MKKWRDNNNQVMNLVECLLQKEPELFLGWRFVMYYVIRKKFIFIIIFLAFGCEIGLLGIVVTKGTNQMNRLRKNPDFTIEVPMDTVTYLVEKWKK